MKILSLCSSYVNSILRVDNNIEKINYDYLPSLIYREAIIKQYGENKEIQGIDSITKDYNCVLIDILSFIKMGVEYRGIIYDKDIIKVWAKELKEDKANVFIEAIKVLISELLRNFKEEQLFLLNFKKMSFVREEEEKEYNFFYKNISKILKNFNLIEIENEIKIENGVIFSDEVKGEINLRVKEIKIDSNSFKGEKYYPSIKNIKYIFEKSKIFNKEKLIVVFSSFSSDIPKYNYINTLKVVDCNKLFILDDYGSKGSYYIGLDGGFEIETSVISLITHIMNENNITFNNVISIGSSKGGSAALYYGLKYNFGNVIAGAPQYKIGTYLIDLSIKDYANDIFGGLEPSKRIKYDNLIKMVAKEGQATKISILTGDGDPQYKRVLKEFEEVSKKFKLNLNLDKCDIESHSDISKVFPKYLVTNIEEILNGKGCIKGNMLLNILSKFN